MVFAGAIEIEPEVVVLLLLYAAVAALAVASVGGLIAAVIAGRGRAFFAGTAVCGGTALVTADAAGGGAIFIGYAASALVGLAYRSRDHAEPS